VGGFHDPPRCPLPLPGGRVPGLVVPGLFVPGLFGAITAAACCPPCLRFFSFSPPSSPAEECGRVDESRHQQEHGGIREGADAEVPLP
jgi:hypothetical protein